MVRFISLCVVALLLTACGGSQKSAVEQPGTSKRQATDTMPLLTYQDAITDNFLYSRLAAFSADSMEGRETALKGQKMAAEYLAQQYDALGMKPVGDDASYMQAFDVRASRTDSMVFQTFTIDDDGNENIVSESVNSGQATGNFIRQFGGEKTINAEVVFAGYGIQNEKLGIDHLQGADIEGKWVMIVTHDIPQVMDGDSLYFNQRLFNRSIMNTLRKRGAAGIISLSDSTALQFEEAVQARQHGFGRLKNMQLAYRSSGDEGGTAWSYTAVNPLHAAMMLGVDGIEGLHALVDDLRTNIRDFEAYDTGYGFTQIPYTEQMVLGTENVVAFMEGADPKLKDEVVVLSAHYDHVGIGVPDSTGDAIYNGANDDGSGTIGLLGVAKAFAEAREHGVAPRRSILFLSVAGEEKGLLGSRYYSDHPIYPIQKTIANLNTDMIGRIDPEHEEKGDDAYVYIIGAEIISSQLDSLIKAGNDAAGQLRLDMRYNDLQDPNQFYRRSDHWNFGRLGVPFAFFFNGVHEDYHRPSDEIEKMNMELYTKTVRSVYAAAVMVANAETAPVVDNQEFIEITKGD